MTRVLPASGVWADGRLESVALLSAVSPTDPNQHGEVSTRINGLRRRLVRLASRGRQTGNPREEC